MEIKRDLYLDRLKRRMQNGLIKVITGLRRSGKSYLLFKIFRDYLSEIGVDGSHVIEIEFDRQKNIGLRNVDSACEYVKGLMTDGEMYYVLLDEVQFSFRKVMVVKDDVRTTRDENGIVMMSLKNFLLDPNSLDA